MMAPQSAYDVNADSDLLALAGPPSEQSEEKEGGTQTREQRSPSLASPFRTNAAHRIN
jgi:hypothetical protein